MGTFPCNLEVQIKVSKTSVILYCSMMTMELFLYQLKMIENHVFIINLYLQEIDKKFLELYHYTNIFLFNIYYLPNT